MVNCVREYGLELRERPDNSQVGKILRGSIDMHVHFGPEPTLLTRQNALVTALAAREAGIRGIVLKNHAYSTAPLASLVSELVPSIAVFGSISLEYECGGLNVYAVEAAAKLGAKVVWMPLFCAKNSKDLARKIGFNIRGSGISILGADGKLVPEVDDILKVIKDYDMVLATGHLSAPEILALVDRAKQLSVTKIVVTHAMSNFYSESILKPEERQMLAKQGVLIEHTAWEILPTGERTDPEEMAAAIKSEGPSNCIMSSDCGSLMHTTPAEGLRMVISTMIKCGLSEDDITCMVKLNPAKLLGLPPEEESVG